MDSLISGNEQSGLKQSAPDDAGIGLELKLKRESDPSEKIRISVRNGGNGFPDSVLSGTYGFGLLMVDSLAQQHGGSVILENTPEPLVTVTMAIP